MRTVPRRTQLLSRGLVGLLGSFVLGSSVLAGCTFLHFMGYPEVDFSSRTPSQQAANITLATGQGRDGTKALRMSVEPSPAPRAWPAASAGEQAGRRIPQRVRLWVQCLNAELSVLLVSEQPLPLRDRCVPLEARARDGAGGGRLLRTRACVSDYSPTVFAVEQPVAFLDFVQGAQSLHLTLGQGGEEPVQSLFAPVTDPDFVGQIRELCPADWQLERRTKDPANGGTAPGGQTETSAARPPVGRAIDPAAKPAPLPEKKAAAGNSANSSTNRGTAGRGTEHSAQGGAAADMDAQLRDLEELSRAASRL